ncbi:MarR family winged helix-turn-helix transcriptional regulator [Actinopolymorpha singaporensis]|uniref:DNA-binding transcriptional regulator, MarR family n=1 Tax=Actinopolymorpha singaporensis TaxID=117157 RepID=A0A1H1LGQ9_9ACTN|nr:MarR family transcriptional regulator [Actinopolymorpha singaporensis]SDR73607.1 DNA-binding transcriptional regulator, MarR family [Actinopolymorpha singaporensis]
MPSSTLPVKSDAGLASVLRISVMRLSRRLRNQRAADHQLTANQLGVMSTVNRHGALTIGEIAALEKVRPPSTTRTVSSLEALGLAVREAHPTDGRQVVVRLADEGRRILAEDRKRRDAWLAQRLRELSPDEKEILRQAAPILERLAAA